MIEVIGDSITGGFGNMISDNSGNFTTATQDGTRTYAALAARALGANASVLSRSGICYVTGSDRDSMYPFYTQTAALPGKSASVDYWDFDANPVDVVVINLGTNDTGARIDGNAISAAQYTEHAVEFIRLVRANNPYATIVWAYGMMTQSRGDCIAAAVKQLNDEGDDDVYYLSLPTMSAAKEGVGTHGHPSYLSHLKAAGVLAEFLADELGATVDRGVMLAALCEFAEDYWLTNVEGYVAVSVEALQRAVDEAQSLVAAGATDEQYAAATEAIYTARDRLASDEDYSDEYIVIDTCDEKGSWSINGKKNAKIDEDAAILGGCFTTTGDGWINFMNTSGSIDVEMPADWQKWYIEMWMYIDDPAALTNGCNIEISQVVDKIEFAWDIKSLGLKSGWNYLQLPVSGAAKANVDQLKSIKNIRIFLINLPSEVTMKVDDIVLAQGKFALYRGELDDLIAEAEAGKPAEDSALGIALARAKAAQSQRQVDVATDALAALLGY
jgi:lysophospholipase L1-like esterase